MKLNLGSGDQKYHDFISVDLYDDASDVKDDMVTLAKFENETVDGIVSFQAIEHTKYNQAEEMFANWYRVLKPNGTVWVETVDIDVVCSEILGNGLEDKWIYNIYGQYYRPWDLNRYGSEAVFFPGAIHYQCFNFTRLKRLLEQAGFKDIEKVEDKYSKYEETLSVKCRK